MNSKRIAFATHGFAVVVCRHPATGKFLAVNESKGRGWWLPAGHVDRGQSFVDAAFAESKEEAGININIKGVLAVEHTLQSAIDARMRVIFYAEPSDPNQLPKSTPDEESEGAAWLTLKELEKKSVESPPSGLRGEELLRWGRYVQSGALIAPMIVSANGKYEGFFRIESEGPALDTVLVPRAMREGDSVFPVPISMPSLPLTTPTSTAETESDLQTMLLRGDVDINRGMDAKHWTLLHRAVAMSNLTALRQLLLAGANPNVSTHKGRTPLHMAISRGEVEIVRLLLLAGADASAVDCDGVGPDGFIQPENATTKDAIISLLSMQRSVG